MLPGGCDDGLLSRSDAPAFTLSVLMGIAWIPAFDWLISNWALSTFLLGVIFTLSMVAYITIKYTDIMLNVLRDTPLPIMPPAHLIPKIEGGETVDFSAQDGLTLRGTWLRAPPQVRRRGCIVFCHEFGLDRHSVNMYALPLLQAGYDLFTFDFRNHGESARDKSYQSRQWCEQREVADALGAFAYVEATLEEEGFAPEFGVFGVSRGACAAIIAAVETPRLTAMVCDGVFTTDRLWEHYAKRWAYIFARVRFVYEKHPPIFWKYLRWCLERRTRRALNCHFPSVRRAIRRTHPWRPTFFIHGQRDSYVPEDIARELHAHAPEPKYSWIVPKARHNQAVLLFPQEYHTRVQRFFDRHLAKLDEPIRLDLERQVSTVAAG